MSAVSVDVRPDGVAVLTVDQPGSRANVLSEGLWADLGAAVAAVADRADLKGLVLASGKPGMFVAGADLKFLAAVPAPNDPAVRDLILGGLRVLDRLESLPFPTCAAIDGAALGGGLELALACDYRVVGPNPRVELGLPETRLGLIPGWGGTQRLPRVVGLPAAWKMVEAATPLPAARAVAAGLADAFVADEPVVDAAARLVTRPGDWRGRRAAKRGPVPAGQADLVAMTIPTEPAALAAAFDCLAYGAGLPLAEAVELETKEFLRLAGSAESKGLIAGFFAARKKG